MKVSRSSKARAAGRHDQAMRAFPESFQNYQWWLFQDTEPAEGYVLEEYIRWAPARPRPPQLSTRQPEHLTLSRRALRKRLYRHHVPKALWSELLDTYAGFSRVNIPGEPGVKQRWGYSVAKAVTRHVKSMFVFLDEFAYYAPPEIPELFRVLRQVSGEVPTATQTLPKELTQQLTPLATNTPVAEAEHVRYNPLLAPQF